MSARDTRFFDDIARVAGGAAGMLASVRQQVTEEMKARFDELAERMDLVPRADLERVEAMVADLQKRLDALEGKSAPKTQNTKAAKKAPAKPVKKTAAKKTATKKTAKKK